MNNDIGNNFQIDVPDLVDMEKLDKMDELVENKDVVKVLPDRVIIKK